MITYKYIYLLYSIRGLLPIVCILFSLTVLLCGCETKVDDEIVPVWGSVNGALAKEETEARNAPSATKEQNLLVNGGLEEWHIFPMQYDKPIGWLLHNNRNVRKNTKNVYEGSYSAKMQALESGETARIDQIIAVVPGQEKRIRFHYFVEQWQSRGARTYCYFRTAAAEKYNLSIDELQSFYEKNAYYVIRGGGNGLTYFPHDLNVWHTFDETIEVPPTAYFFVFGINSYFGTTIYVDDCWVVDETESIPSGIRDISI